MSWPYEPTGKIEPTVGEQAEAFQNPGGWVYRIGGDYGPEDYVPPEAIMGAWKVDETGQITGDFIPNSKYRP